MMYSIFCKLMSERLENRVIFDSFALLMIIFNFKEMLEKSEDIMSIEMTVSEIAEVLGLSRQAINNRVKELPEEDTTKK